MASVRTFRSPSVAHLRAIVAYLRPVGGLLLIVIGLAGLVVPVIPGILLMMAGVAVLGRDHPLISPVLDWLRRHREAWRKRWRARGPGRRRS
jgi:uncharacterized membrane protein YbaN (DUF454 family)